ncbi:MAG: GDP-L-fucose synthase family protein [Nitrosarchaeum sp.]
MTDKNIKIFVAGHRGMVGSACCRKLIENGYENLILKSSSELDLRNQLEVEEFFKTEKPNVIIDAAAKVGGILANNSYPYEFLMDNMLIQNNLIRASLINDVKKFIFLGSSCIYPKYADQPLKEEYLLTSSLEPTNQWYAIAKISGVKLIEAIRIQFKKDFVSLMPTNLYGMNDNFDLNSSHVLPAMIRKFHDAKSKNEDTVNLWGSGTPKREFLHVDDLANAVIFALQNTLPESLYNVGSGTDLTIRDLAEKIKNIVGYEGEIDWDSTKPDGTPRKLMDSSKLKSYGWNPNISLDEGIKDTYLWYLDNISE